MPLNAWSESILIAELFDEPNFSEDMNTLIRQLDDADQMPDVIINMMSVSYLNSSNIAQLLRVRKKLAANDGRMRLCSLSDRVWSELLITGLDKVFDFTDDVATSLASLHIEE